MKRVYLTLCLFAMMVLSIGCTTTFAASWYYVGGSENGRASVYIDNASVVKNSRAAVVWVRYDMSDGSMIMQRIGYTRRPKTYTLLAFATYDTQGELVISQDVPDYARVSQPIVPDSIAEAVWYCIWPN